jgi:hypothetical protein
VLTEAIPPWTVRPASKQVLKEWETALAEEADLITSALQRLRHRPLHRGDNPRRTGPLHGGLAERTIAGVKLPQWHHELTSGDRIWYCPDKKSRIVWITKVSLAHPRQTD